MCKNLKHLIKIIFFVIIYQNLAYSIDIDDGGVTTAKQTFTSADTTITISNSSTLRNSLNNMININGQDNGTVIIEAGSTVETTGGKSNPINGNAASGLTITNSGTIKSASSKAINLTDATTGTLTNNSGGVCLLYTSPRQTQTPSPCLASRLTVSLFITMERFLLPMMIMMRLIQLKVMMILLT